MATKPKPLRIVGLKQIKGKESFTFGMCCMAGLTVNGFTYFPKSHSILPPHFRVGTKKVPLVKGFGVHWVRVRELLKKEMEKFNETSGS